MKSSAHPNPMPRENQVKSKCYQHTSAIIQVVGDSLDIFDDLQIIELKLASWMIMSKPRYISC